jgi:hypothetical protein
MASTKRLTAQAQSQLKVLQAALEKDFGQKASGDDIVSALVCGVSAPQLFGMLIALNKHAAKAKDQNS